MIETVAEVSDSWELIAAAQRGDSAAYGRLYDRYVNDVFRYVLCRTGDRYLTEDLTSEAFLRGLRRINTITRPATGGSPAAWFVTIARNLILDHLRSSRYRLDCPYGNLEPLEELTTRTDHYRLTDTVWLNIPEQSGPEDHALTAELNRALWGCVNQLPADQRECLILRFVTDLSVSDAAAVLHRSEGAVKALQHRAVRRLTQLLPKEL